MFTVTRSQENPFLSPLQEHPWEASATFNWCPVKEGRTTHVLYRAMSEPELMKENHLQLSVIGRATTVDGVHFTDRAPLITPERDFEKYGCEDPRVTKFGATHYIFYTALSTNPFTADGIKIALAKSKDLKKIDSKHLITPFNAKAMALFPEKINGKMAVLLTANTDRPPSHIAYAEFNKEEDLWSPDFWKDWYANLESHRLGVRRASDDQVELGAPPVKTKHGWLVVYSHIQHYFGGNRSFGVEAILLDLENPRKIVGRTYGPFLVPETHYEKIGNVSNVIFPSGVLINGENLDIYYGAADMTCCVASVNLDNLLQSMIPNGSKRHFVRFPGNPIIAPRPGKDWEKKGTFNPAAVELQGKVHLLYRAMSGDATSTFGYASTKDGFSIDERLDEPVYLPREDFEKKHHPGNSGCEDPRLVEVDDRLYMTYTAYDGNVPRVAVSSIGVSDFLAKNWKQWSPPNVITPPNVHEKDSCVFPEKIRGKYMILHRVRECVCADFVSSLDFSVERVNQCVEILSPRPGMWDGRKVGIAAPPVKTKNGWLLLYHGVSDSTTYRVGAVLLDLKDPTVAIARTTSPILEPEEDYERNGEVPNVVFPCGIVIRGGVLFIYYGAADSTVGVVTVKLSAVLKMLSV